MHESGMVIVRTSFRQICDSVSVATSPAMKVSTCCSSNTVVSHTTYKLGYNCSQPTTHNY